MCRHLRRNDRRKNPRAVLHYSRGRFIARRFNPQNPHLLRLYPLVLCSNEDDMLRLRKLVVRQFRVLETADIELRPLTVVIGPNGSGKTSLLEALSLLAVSA